MSRCRYSRLDRRPVIALPRAIAGHSDGGNVIRFAPQYDLVIGIGAKTPSSVIGADGTAADNCPTPFFEARVFTDSLYSVLMSVSQKRSPAATSCTVLNIC